VSGTMEAMDTELRDWLRALATAPSVGPGNPDGQTLTAEGAEYLVAISRDGTLKSILTELGAADPELAG
jgi:hypothetical protein